MSAILSFKGFEKIITAAVLILLPFFFIIKLDVENQLSLPKLMGVVLLAGFLFSIWIYKNFGLGLALCNFVFFFTALYSGFGPMRVYPLLYWVSCIVCGAWFSSNLKKQNFFFNCIIWSGVLSASYAYIQMSGHDFILHYAPGIDSRIPISFLGQSTKFGAFMAITASISLAKKQYVQYFFQLIPAVATGSSFTAAAIVIGSLISIRALIGPKKSILILLVIITTAALGWIMKPGAEIYYEQGRYAVWKQSIGAVIHGSDYVIKDGSGNIRDAGKITASPWFGFGPGSFYGMYPLIQLDELRQHGDFVRAHNDYVQAFFEFGSIGMLCILILILNIFCSYMDWFYWISEERLAAMAGLSAVLVNAIGNFPFQLAPHNMIAAVCACILLRKYRVDCLYGIE